jgi:hypothetical protein
VNGCANPTKVGSLIAATNYRNDASATDYQLTDIDIDIDIYSNFIPTKRINFYSPLHDQARPPIVLDPFLRTLSPSPILLRTLSR